MLKITISYIEDFVSIFETSPCIVPHADTQGNQRNCQRVSFCNWADPLVSVYRWVLKICENRNYWSSFAISLQDLDMSSNEIFQIDPFAFNGLYALQYLDISYNELTSAPSISGVKTTLIAIDLAGNKIKYISDAYFDSCKTIRNIELRYNRLSAIPNVGNVSSTLHSLSLAGNYISDVKSIYGIYFPVLRTLSLDSNKISKFSLPPPNFVPNLRWLSLWSNNLSRIYIPLSNTERRGQLQIELDDNPWNCNGPLGWTHKCKPAINPTDMICMEWLLLNGMICTSPKQVQGRTPKDAGKNTLLHRINTESVTIFRDLSFINEITSYAHGGFTETFIINKTRDETCATFYSTMRLPMV